MVDLVGEWASINTNSLNVAGLDLLLGHIRKDFQMLGAQMELINLPPYSSINGNAEVSNYPLGRVLRLVKRPETQGRVLMCIHYDTVFRSSDGLEENIEITSDLVKGPGVADAKGGVAVMLTALEALERSPWAHNLGWEVLLNPDEEIGSPGSAQILRQAATRNNLGLLFEPSLPDGSMVDSRKGSGNFTAVVRGRSAHAGRAPDRGRNAINALAELIVDLNCFAESMGAITLNIGGIEGGGPLNVVPDLAIARFNVRVSSPEDMVAVKTKLESLREAFQFKDGLSLEFHGGFARPPKMVDPDTLRVIDLVTSVADELGLALSWRHSGGASDGNILAAAGLPTVDTMGPRGDNIHSDQEYLISDSLVERAMIAAAALMRIASNESLW
jgi:glutamate carboxypeptidase